MKKKPLLFLQQHLYSPINLNCHGISYTITFTDNAEKLVPEEQENPQAYLLERNKQYVFLNALVVINGWFSFDKNTNYKIVVKIHAIK